MTPQQKFSLIVSRQGRFKWGDIYIPSTLAVTSEAPKGSRISRLNSRKLGRTLHAMSTPERVFTQLALYHPDLLDIHEQKMLSPVTSVHPLHGHPLTKGRFSHPITGTVEVAKQIGFKHYEISVENLNGRPQKVPFPYQGDLLLYMCGQGGIPYAVNWTVKDKKEAFVERNRLGVKTPLQQKKDRDRAQLRAKLEEYYYSSAGIRTVQVSLDHLDPVVIANLDLLYGAHGLPTNINAEVLSEFSCEIKEAVKSGYPVARIAIKYGARWGFRDQFLARIYQDIWNRDLLVSLFEPILIDHPLNSEERDLLSIYGSLFEEVEP
ncbi:transposase [Pseudomonas fluorescens]|uniref:transposase n=2 Tax=Pseudomonas fluorescens TaxID=294 RepID=UPI00123F7081|nr:transposase [Pseudomonas fluorescens]